MGVNVVHRLMRRFLGEVELARMLGESWAAGVPRGMQAHARMMAARRAALRAEQDPERVRQRREERTLAAQERHRQRLEAKKERDRAWWASHERPGGGTGNG